MAAFYVSGVSRVGCASVSIETFYIWRITPRDFCPHKPLLAMAIDIGCTFYRYFFTRLAPVWFLKLLAPSDTKVVQKKENHQRAG